MEEKQRESPGNAPISVPIQTTHMGRTPITERKVAVRRSSLFIIATEGAVTEKLYFEAFNKSFVKVKVLETTEGKSSPTVRTASRLIDSKRPKFCVDTPEIESANGFIGRFGWSEDTSYTLYACLPSVQLSSPLHVLARLKSWRDQGDIVVGDEFWIVADVDSWLEEHLEAICKSPDVKAVVSNPCFEYWLSLHYSDAGGAVWNAHFTPPPHKSARSQTMKTWFEKCTQAIGRTADDFDHCILYANAAVGWAKSRDGKRLATGELWPKQYPGTTVYLLVQAILER